MRVRQAKGKARKGMPESSILCSRVEGCRGAGAEAELGEIDYAYLLSIIQCFAANVRKLQIQCTYPTSAAKCLHMRGIGEGWGYCREA